jgi:hypothetical protein
MPFLVPLAAGVAIASTVYQTARGIDAASDAKKAAKQAEKERKKLLEEQAAEEAKAKANETRASQAGEMQRRRARGAGGRAGTILTGPLGLIEPATTQRKTLLGQ